MGTLIILLTTIFIRRQEATLSTLVDNQTRVLAAIEMIHEVNRRQDNQAAMIQDAMLRLLEGGAHPAER